MTVGRCAEEGLDQRVECCSWPRTASAAPAPSPTQEKKYIKWRAFVSGSGHRRRRTHTLIEERERKMREGESCGAWTEAMVAAASSRSGGRRRRRCEREDGGQWARENSRERNGRPRERNGRPRGVMDSAWTTMIFLPMWTFRGAENPPWFKYKRCACE